MSIDWLELQKVLIPIKDYEDLTSRFRVSFSYPFVREKFNFTLPELRSYTEALLGGDARGRYKEYMLQLVDIISSLQQAGVQTVHQLIILSETREKFEVFIEESSMVASDVVQLLKYLVYWLIPAEKYMSGLVQPDPDIINAIKVLRIYGIRTNLELLQSGISADGRKSLADTTGLPEALISDLVNRADLSRLPWSSKATISNIIGAGYGSLDKLSHADPEELYADFFSYGKSIDKNLKLGNEIENSYRIAKLIPVILNRD